MRNKNQKGFSLIELLLVVVIIGVIASIAVPSLLKAKSVAENGGTFSIMRTISTLQIRYFIQNNRFARLDEINAGQNNTLGTISGTTLIRGNFHYEMNPITPTDEQLKEGYEIIVTRQVASGETPYSVKVDQSGTLTQILPAP